METDISTPRLRLIRLTDTSEGSQHVQWFHENWTDPDATAWSLHGPCRDLAESRAWMITHLTNYDTWFYAVFETPSSTSASTPESLPNKGLGPMIGSVSLRIQSTHNGQPTLPPFPPPTPSTLPLLFRLIGYGFFRSSWGKGYATEANAAMIDAYAKFAREEKPEFLHYLEAGVDEGNPGSRKVLGKLGFKEVGWKTEVEPVFLAGEWRYGGYWILGRYL